MTDITLKDGSITHDERLDRLYEEDWRSLNHLVGQRTTKRGLVLDQHQPRSYTYRCELWLDQGVEGACVSTGCGHEAAARPVEVQGITFPWCRENIYHPAQHEDPWRGCSLGQRCPIEPMSESYEGTSVLAGVKQLQRLGFVTSYVWAITLKEAILGLGYFGPAILGFNWYEGMFDTDADGFIHPTGRLMGGHCLLAQAVKIVYKDRPSWKNFWRTRTWEDVDLERSYVTLHNSWGKNWGVNGRAKISLNDFNRLLLEQGEVCFVERTEKKSV